MALDELPVFMAAIRRLESGRYEGNYSARGPVVKKGMYAGDRAVGAYQIMGKNWSAWAREAGLAGASIDSKVAQDKVAAHKFGQYYKRYGDWRLVAIAWFAGPGRADKAARQGIASVSGIRDQLGTGASQYAKLITEYMTQASRQGYGELSEAPPEIDTPTGPKVKRTYEDPFSRPTPSDSLAVLEGAVLGDQYSDPPDAARSQLDQNLQGILQGLSNAVRQSAMARRKQPLDDTLETSSGQEVE